MLTIILLVQSKASPVSKGDILFNAVVDSLFFTAIVVLVMVLGE